MYPIKVGLMMASFTIEKRAKANGDFSYRCKIVVKQKTQLYTENLKHSVKKNKQEHMQRSAFKK